MPMTIDEKRDAVAKIRDRAILCPSLALIDARGLDASNMLALRNLARQKGCSVTLVKNTLARRAWTGTPKASAIPLLDGSLAHVYGLGESPAQTAALFAKACSKAKVAGGFYAGQPQDSNSISAIAAMPPRQELLSRLAYALGEPARKLARALDQVADGKDGAQELALMA